MIDERQTRTVKVFLWASLSLPMVFGALVYCWLQGLVPWLSAAAGGGALSLLSMGWGFWGLFCRGSGGEHAQSHSSSRKPASQKSKDNIFGGLGRRQAVFSVFMDHLPALAFIKDRQGRYLYINAACNELLKKSPGEVIGRRDKDLWPEEACDLMCRNDAQIVSGNQVYSAIEPVWVDNEERHHLVTKFAIHGDPRSPLLGCIAFDMTEKVRAEEENARLEHQLIQSQKMEAIGTLAGGIAHDFNNVLAAIMGYVELALFDAEPGGKVQEALEQVLKATRRATDLVRQILTFSRKTDQERQPLDPKPLVNEVLKLIRATLPTTIEIRPHIETDGALVMAEATQLHQVILNLCTNAAHAMEENGGLLEVRLEKRHLNHNDAVTCDVTPGPYLEICISDTGHGIAPALKRRIFDPYFTTKAQGKGTGMGLAVVQGIVQSHGGAIDVESQPGKGTRFSVLFPVTTKVVELSDKNRTALPGGKESVLFVDDEPVLVELGQRMLTRLGYSVTTCSGSLEALELFQENPHRFDLVITDTTMPHMTGDVLASRILDLRGDIPVFLCTGYSEQITRERASQIGIAAFLMKPLSINDLALTLRHALDKRLAEDAKGFLKAAHS